MKNITKKSPFTLSKNEVTALVPFGTTGSSLGMRLTQSNRENTIVSSKVRSIILGSILGDGSLDKPGTNKYPLFVLVQSYNNREYAWFIYTQLNSLCQSLPGLGTSVRRGVRHYYIRVWTRSYSFLTEYYDKFYITMNNKRMKVLDIEYIILNINELSLAIWAIEDGKKVGYGFGLCTQSFQFVEVYKLVGVLHYKFNLACSVHTLDKNKPIIYIKAESIENFRSLVIPYFQQSIKYKLRGGRQVSLL